MIYHRQLPPEALQTLINCYWHIDSEGDSEITTEKIVPDGYSEVILHYGAPYEINISGTWELQAPLLLAGQIRKHFFLRNTGASGMVGIKFQPAALTYLFNIDQSVLTDKVIALPAILAERLAFIVAQLKDGMNIDNVFNRLNELFLALPPVHSSNTSLDAAMDRLLEKKGNLSIKELTDVADCSERQLERYFKRFIGLSPKFYARVIRLAHVFELMQAGTKSWSDLVYDSGFYDQSHFIKNFKEFTGEDPTAYGFEEKNMANFHLKS